MNRFFRKCRSHSREGKLWLVFPKKPIHSTYGELNLNYGGQNCDYGRLNFNYLVGEIVVKVVVGPPKACRPIICIYNWFVTKPIWDSLSVLPKFTPF